MNEVKLKPCPFCGKAAQLKSDNRYPKPECERITAYEVICTNWNCIIYNCDNKYYRSPQKAIAAWNRRTAANPSEINANGFKTDEERRFDKLQTEIQKRLTDELKRF
ncbi:MAG: Lar family restriction alleviation protein [Clostridia bacterium]|nr:Lar family restriction alleviation protein [Clostridia bacterium]